MDLAGRTKTTGYESIWRPTSAKWRHKPTHGTAHVGPRVNNRPTLLRLDSVGEISSGEVQVTNLKMTPKIALAEPSTSAMKAKTMGNVNNLLASLGAAFINVGKLEGLGRKGLADNSQKFRFFNGEKENSIPGVTFDDKYISVGDFCSNGNRCDKTDMNNLHSTVNSFNPCAGFPTDAFAQPWYTESSIGSNGFCTGFPHKLGNKNLWQQPCNNLNTDKMSCFGQLATVSAVMYPFTEYICNKNMYSTANMMNRSTSQNEGNGRTPSGGGSLSGEQKNCYIEKHNGDLVGQLQDLSIANKCKSHPAKNQKVPEMSELKNKFAGRAVDKKIEPVTSTGFHVSVPSKYSMQPCRTGKISVRCLKRAFSYPLSSSNHSLEKKSEETGSVVITSELKADESLSVQRHCGDKRELNRKCIDQSSSSNGNLCGQASRTDDLNICEKLNNFSFSVKKQCTDSALPPVPNPSSNFTARATCVEDGQRKPKSCKRPRPSSKKRRRLKARQQSCLSGSSQKASNNEYGDVGYSMQRSKKCKLENHPCVDTKTLSKSRSNSQEKTDKMNRHSSCSPVSFILGVNTSENDNGPNGSYTAYSVSVLLDNEESEFSEFEEDGIDGVDFSSYQDFFPACGGLNPLNFKVSISISPSPECGLTSPGLAAAKGLDAINLSWVNICDNSKAKPKSSKKVQFVSDDTLVTVHPMIAWSYAYKAARKGPWEEYARDQERFNRRLREAEGLLNPILQHTHRDVVYKRLHQPV